VENLYLNAPVSTASKGMEHLILVVQELSLARDLETVMAIVRTAARRLTGADGATFVLRTMMSAIMRMKTPSVPCGRGAVSH
jgi:hypothetical protein